MEAARADAEGRFSLAFGEAMWALALVPSSQEHSRVVAEPVSPELVLVDPVLADGATRAAEAFLHDEPSLIRDHDRIASSYAHLIAAAEIEQPETRREPRSARVLLLGIVIVLAFGAMLPGAAPTGIQADARERVTAGTRLVWTAATGAARYHVELRRGPEIVLAADVAGPALDITGRARASLAPGTYRWRVWRVAKGKPVPDSDPIVDSAIVVRSAGLGVEGP